MYLIFLTTSTIPMGYLHEILHSRVIYHDPSPSNDIKSTAYSVCHFTENHSRLRVIKERSLSLRVKLYKNG